MEKEKYVQNTMLIPDRYLKEVYEKTPLDQFRKKLFAAERGKQRVVNFVGYQSEVAYAMKNFQSKIDGGQKEREEWLHLNGSEKDCREIQQQIALEKMRTVPSEEIQRLERELSIVQAPLAKLQKEQSK
jgi:hypothetical protein